MIEPGSQITVTRGGPYWRPWYQPIALMVDVGDHVHDHPNDTAAVFTAPLRGGEVRVFWNGRVGDVPLWVRLLYACGLVFTQKVRVESLDQSGEA
jgi:hypothetical protein